MARSRDGSSEFERSAGEIVTFESLGLSDSLLRAVAEKGYEAPTPIQSAAIPAILRGDDLRASAQTGSGKTAAFALPILQRLIDRGESPRTQALILVPTRELAMQIFESFRTYSRYTATQLRIVAAFGGVSINPQMMALRGAAHIVVATPGRLLDLVEHNALSLKAVQTLVLDEADKLFEFGFADELSRIISMLPRRQTLLFSATFPQMVQALAEIVLNSPTRIDIESTEETTPAIEQRSISVDAGRRTQLLRRLVEEHKWSQVLVFVATTYATEHVADKLRRAGMEAAALHGELTQGARTQALTQFKSGKIKILIATDLAARGIDIPRLSAVVNYDLPRSAVDYTHRIGRTGRAGESGSAVSFVTADAEAHFRLIEKRNGFRLTRETVAGFEPQDLPAPQEPKAATNGGVKGKRKSKKDKLREAQGRS